MRYIVEKATNHRCCYDYKVSDTSIKKEWNDDQTICDCRDKEAAELIALALNNMERTPNVRDL